MSAITESFTPADSPLLFTDAAALNAVTTCGCGSSFSG